LAGQAIGLRRVEEEGRVGLELERRLVVRGRLLVVADAELARGLLIESLGVLGVAGGGGGRGDEDGRENRRERDRGNRRSAPHGRHLNISGLVRGRNLLGWPGLKRAPLRARAAWGLLGALLLVACSRPCRDGTLFLDVALGAASAADSLAVSVSVQ